MKKNTSILLGDHFHTFINNEIASGRFSSTSEVVRASLRLLENEQRKLQELHKELEFGEKSPMLENFDPYQHLKELHHKHS